VKQLGRLGARLVVGAAGADLLHFMAVVDGGIHPGEHRRTLTGGALELRVRAESYTRHGCWMVFIRERKAAEVKENVRALVIQILVYVSL
jgi:hypothetical protein